MNQTGIVPTEFQVLVLPDKVEEKTATGVWMPEEVKEREQAAATTGKLIAVSPVAFTYADWPEGSILPRPGNRVAFGRYAGTNIKGKDGEEYRLMKDQDIYAVVWDD